MLAGVKVMKQKISALCLFKRFLESVMHSKGGGLREVVEKPSKGQF